MTNIKRTLKCVHTKPPPELNLTEYKRLREYCDLVMRDGGARGGDEMRCAAMRILCLLSHKE